ncbi:hypothetical protein L4C54_11325 [Vibrio lamellibrachiae]|uniref:hypothetical protein n=1 Tax=Vibrio lamellibrachiae TaxID=2910253 RepID=UPI003D0EBD14
MHKAILYFFVVFSLHASVYAATLPNPSGEVILSVSGNIEHSNSEIGVEFDEGMIEQLDTSIIKTKNHVVKEVAIYKGPTLYDVLELAGSKGDEVKVIAWDDYVVTIPISTIKKYGVLLATHEDGKRMTLDDKGPFFVVFPFTEYSEIRNDLYYNLSVWQVKALVVE